MTSANDISTTSANTPLVNDVSPLDVHSNDSLSAIANTADDEAAQIRKYPGWFHDLIRHLRRYGPWRLLIKSDNTIDLEYLTALALRAQQRAGRPSSPGQQLNLFPLSAEVRLMNANPQRSETAAIPSFTIITGTNRPVNQNTITLPDEILTIRSGEQLHQYLRRVADTAVAATIVAYGSQQAALARLGSHTPSPARPTLSLAPPPSPKTQDRKPPQ